MNDHSLSCLEPRRAARLRERASRSGETRINGLDAVEVSQDFLKLRVYFFGTAPEGLCRENFVISGGKRIRELRVIHLRYCFADDPRLDDCVDLELDQAGDLAPYELKVVELDRGGASTSPLQGLDPCYAAVSFSFSVVCANDLDCRDDSPCPPERWPEPDINYVAKDYASFRQLIFDRLALLNPEWTERHIPDLGVTLVELLAYAGDYLSYYQDAVATEAYLHTARQRISVRRHVRLIDYHMHEGCNARTIVHVGVNSDVQVQTSDIYFVTKLFPSLSQADLAMSHDELMARDEHRYEVFEPMRTNTLEFVAAHNEIDFYTWGNRECCVIKGATRASLLDRWVRPASVPQQEEKCTPTIQKEKPQKKKDASPPLYSHVELERQLRLAPGDLLLFEEVKGPKTGHPADVDRTHRHVVRLTKVEQVVDALIPIDSGEFSGQPTPILNIEWAKEDALPFSLCLSAIGAPPECLYREHISVARGNLVLVDHGKSLGMREELGLVPLGDVQSECVCECESTEPRWKPGWFRPRLRYEGLTFQSTLPTKTAPASVSLRTDPRTAVSDISVWSIPSVMKSEGPTPLFTVQDIQRLEEGDSSQTFGQKLKLAKDGGDHTLLRHLSPDTIQMLSKASLPEMSPALRQALLADLLDHLLKWEPQLDLINSRRDDAHVVVEMDESQFAYLRFGDGKMGKAPQVGAAFFATYRIGNGPRGNVGAETLRHIVFREGIVSGVITQVRNPFPAAGGTAPESLEEVKVMAPATIRQGQDRAVAPQDYARLAEEHPGVQRADAQFRWLGYRQVVQVAIDPLKTMQSDPQLLSDIADRLEMVRRIGHEVEVIDANYVPLDLQIEVCVNATFVRSDVRKAIADQLSSGVRVDGMRGFFHPDNFSFGDSLFLSQLVGAVQSVEGVEMVEVTKFQRLFEGPCGDEKPGELIMGDHEILQVANDSSLPEQGRLELSLKGGM